MSHWTFVAGAYALTLIATCGLVGWAYVSMRGSETDAEAAKRRK